MPIRLENAGHRRDANIGNSGEGGLGTEQHLLGGPLNEHRVINVLSLLADQLEQEQPLPLAKTFQHRSRRTEHCGRKVPRIACSA